MPNRDDNEGKSLSSMNHREKRQIDLIEAALYVAGKPLDLETLSKITNVRSIEALKSLIDRLIERYKTINGALELLKLQDGRYVMQLRPDLAKGVVGLVTKRLLTKGPLKTLSFIAVKQPVTQAYVVKVRGNLAYRHIRLLSERGLISEERLGKTKILKTTTTFADYFNLSSDPKIMKQQLQRIFESFRSGRPTTDMQSFKDTPVEQTQNR
ncbi:MAG: SMC-Scp complex subunit ScpB [Candidatus Bathyarchaeia archaeon]